MNKFAKATKKQSKLRLALFAPAGAGKTFTALRISSGMGGKIALIDTERGSASKYSDRFDFDVAELEKPTIENYVELIQGAAGQYDVLIIDSMSHGWHELLNEVERIARAKFKGNTWSAWSEGTPKQKLLVNTILQFPGHVIATMRTKTEWQVTDGNNGKIKPVRIGLAPEQGKGIEYEFDMLMEISVDHVAQVIKDRTGKYQDKIIEKPGEELGKELIQWLNEGKRVDVSLAVKEIKKVKTLEQAGEVWKKWKMFQSHPDFIKAKEDVKEKYHPDKPKKDTPVSYVVVGGSKPPEPEKDKTKNRTMSEEEVQQCLNIIENGRFADKEGILIDPMDWFKSVTKDRILNKEDYQKITTALQEALNVIETQKA